MRVEKIYRLSCREDGTGTYFTTPFHTTKEDAILQLHHFRDKVYKAAIDDGCDGLSIDTTIELEEISLEDIQDIDDYSLKTIASTWILNHETGYGEWKTNNKLISWQQLNEKK